MPEVSVIIPSYNHAAFVGEAVRSVLDQTLDDLELIVIDDGSSDGSRDVLAGFSDRRMRVIYQENQGTHAVINHGLEMASGRYLALLNSDDRYHPGRLELLRQVFEMSPEAGLTFSYLQMIDENGGQLGVKHGYADFSPWILERPEYSFRAAEDARAVLLAENYLATSSNYFFRREIFAEVGGFRPLRYVHDWDFAIRAAGKAEIIQVPQVLLDYRLHDHNTIRENLGLMIYEICWVLAVHLPQNAHQAWFTVPGIGQRTRQLLHSIYTYGMDRVLNIMLIAGLSDDEKTALEWLSADHPARQECVDYISAGLARMNKGGAGLSPADRIYFGLKRRMRRLVRGK